MTPRIVRLSLAVFFLLVASFARAQPAPAPTPGTLPPPAPVTPIPAKPGDDQLVSIKLADETIDQVLDLLANYTGRAIVRPGNGLPTAPYTVNLKNIPKSEAILALETMLALNQVAVAPVGDRLLKVVALAQAKTEAPEMITGSALDLPPSSKIATRIFQFDFLRAQEFASQLVGMLNSGVGGGVVIFDKANAIMITDTVSNLQRIETLLKLLDKPLTAGMTPKFYTLRNGAKASDVVNRLRTVISGTLQQQLGTATTFNADDRTNQIILISDPRQYPFFDDLIAKLDIKADPNTRNEVIYLKHATAADVQKLLTALVAGQAAAAQRNSSQSVRPGQINIPGVYPSPLPAAPAPAPGAPAVATPTVTGPVGIEGLLSGTNEFSTILNVVNDDRSNAIIVSGTADDIRLIKDLVEKIDSLLAQVAIEVIIAEVTLTDSDVSGISALNLTVGTDTPGGPGGDNGRGTHITKVDALTVGGWNITAGIVNPLSFTAALTNAGQRNHVKVLQSNSIITTHGKQGEFIVSQQQPIIQGSTTTPNTGGTGNTTSSSVTYKDIGVDVKVTPLIGNDGSIQLTIDQKVDDVVGQVTIDGNTQPIIGHRQATSTVNINDGQMIVLGGLQSNKSTNTRAKLGFIREIPIISNLLGGRTTEGDRRELLVFVRPKILPPTEGTKETMKRIDELSNRDQVKQYLVDPTKPLQDPVIEKLK